MKTPSAQRIEALECRIAPAALVGNVLTYTDTDGDAVKVTFTHAAMAAGDFSFSAGGVDGHTDTLLQKLDMVDLRGKTGAGFTVVATQKAGKGDSHADIGYIDGSNTDLGTISVDGNVEDIGAGTGAAGTVGLKSFTALSLGSTSVNTSLSDEIKNAGSFVVKGDLTNAFYTFTGGVKSLSIGGNFVDHAGAAGLDITGDVGTLKVGGTLFGRGATKPSLEVVGKVGVLGIGGSVVGGPVSLDSGLHQIEITGTVGTLTVGGDLAGGAGDGTGTIWIGDDVASAKIGGSIIGGTGGESGSFLTLGKTKSFSLGGAVLGGGGGSSGLLHVGGGAGSVKINGSIVGGTGSYSGSFLADAGVTSLAIGHNLQAVNNTSNTPLNGEGSIEVEGNIGSLTIGGDFISGRSSGGGNLMQSGQIGATGTIGSVKIGGSIFGDPAHFAYISAGANDTNGPVKAIGSFTVKGNVESASLLAGYSFYFTRYNHDSGIGSVSIGGNLIGSYITVGSNAGSDGVPGNHDDSIDVGDAVLGSVKIGGALTGLDGVATAFYIQSSIVNKVAVGKATYTHAQILAAPGHVLDFDSIGLARVATLS